MGRRSRSRSPKRDKKSKKDSVDHERKARKSSITPTKSGIETRSKSLFWQQNFIFLFKNQNTLFVADCPLFGGPVHSQKGRDVCRNSTSV